MQKITEIIEIENIFTKLLNYDVAGIIIEKLKIEKLKEILYLYRVKTIQKWWINNIYYNPGHRICREN